MTTSISTRAQEFRDQLASRVIVADGAMGTVLYSRGVFINRCFDELNLSSPDMVRQIHQEYAKAGAEILETNTFGATRQRLGAFGFAEKLEGHQSGRRAAAGPRGRQRRVRRRRRGPAQRAHRTAGTNILRLKRAPLSASKSMPCWKPGSIC